MTEVRYVFGCRQSQDLPGYENGPCDPFVFTIVVDGKPHSWQSAFALLSFFRDDFVNACRAANTSSVLNVIALRKIWIPSCYLDRPTIEVIDGAKVEELLFDGEKPNSWLSLSEEAV